MELRVSAPGMNLKDSDVDKIQRDLEKIDRRLKEYDLVSAHVRINGNGGAPSKKVTVEVEYGRNHLIATAEHSEPGQALREARDEILRQINDHKRAKGHSDYTKR